MWVADFLKDEGFDWARILVFGGAHADKGFAHQKTDLLHLLQSQNPKILVDLPKLGSEPFSSEVRNQDPSSSPVSSASFLARFNLILHVIATG